MAKKKAAEPEAFGAVAGPGFKGNELPPGYARLLAPEGTTGIGYDGTEYEIVDGFVDVPAEIAPIFISNHGFTAVVED